LLMTETTEKAEELANTIQSINLKRQQLVLKNVKEAEAILEHKALPNFIVVGKEDWNEGVLGIVASQLVQRYDRPAIVLTIYPDKNLVKGSGRSIPSFDLFANLHEVQHLFTNYGGHSQAAGMSLPLENLGDLENELDALIQEQLATEDFRQLIEVSGELVSEEITETIV